MINNKYLPFAKYQRGSLGDQLRAALKGNKSATNAETKLNPFKDDVTVDPNANKNTNGNGGQQQQQNGNGGQQQQQPNVNDYFKNQGLFANINSKNFVQAMKDGDEEAVQGMLEQMMLDATQVALTSATKVANARIEKAVTQAREEMTSSTQHSLAIEQMHEQLGFTSDETIAPLAEDILKKFLGKKDMTVSKAIAATKSYFEQTAKAMGAKLPESNNKGDKGQQNGQRRQNSNNNNSDNDVKPEDQDFLALLSDGRHTVESVNKSANFANASNQGGGNGGEVDLEALLNS